MRRSLVLEASGLKVGDHAEMAVSAPDVAAIGEMFGMEVSLGSAAELGVLSLKDMDGFDRADIERIDQLPGEGARVGIGAVPIGDDGPTEVSVVLRTGDVGATAGMASAMLTLTPPGVEVSTADGPLTWSGSGPLRSVLSLRSAQKVKLTLEVGLTDPFGSPVPLERPFRTKVAFRGELCLPFELEPLSPQGPGNYGLSVVLDRSGIRDETLLEGQVTVPGKEAARSNSRTVEAGSWTDIPVDGQDLSGLDMIDLEGYGPLSWRTEDGRPEALIPAVASGDIRLEYRIGGIHHWVDLRVVPRNPFESLVLTPLSTIVSTGSSFKVRIEYVKKSPSPLTARIQIGGRKRIAASAVLEAIEGVREVTMDVPEDHPPGSQPMILTVSDGGTPVHRETRSDFITVVSSREVPVRLRSPAVPDGEIGAYLFPGESIGSSKVRGDLTVHELDSGRRILVHDGSVVWGDDRGEEDLPEIRRTFIMMSFSEAFSDLKRERASAPGIGDRTVPSGNGRMERPYQGPLPMTRSFMSGRIPSADPGPIGRKVRTFVDSILEGSIGHEDPADLVDEVVRALKGTETGPETDLPAVALSECAGRIGALFGKAMGDRGGPGPSDGWIREMISSVVHLALLRVEVVSVWSDPAILAWDDLRTFRQRSIKSAVEDAIRTLEALSAIPIRAAERLGALRENMRTRSALKHVRSMVLKGSPVAVGTSSGSLKGTVEVLCPIPTSTVDVHVVTPSPSWKVISPITSRDRLGAHAGRFVADDGSTIRIDLELIPPPGAKGGEVVILIGPEKDRLEVEA